MLKSRARCKSKISPGMLGRMFRVAGVIFVSSLHQYSFFTHLILKLRRGVLSHFPVYYLWLSQYVLCQKRRSIYGQVTFYS